MNINEPMTMLTDYIIAIESFIFALSLFWISSLKKQTSIRFWSIAFSTIGIAAILGGTYHGFFFYLDKYNRFILWKATDYLVSSASSIMLLATVLSSTYKKNHKSLFIAIGLKFIFYINLSFKTDDTRYFIASYLLDMLIVLGIQLRIIHLFRSRSALWIISGILVSLVAAGIQQSGFKLNINFNHNDLYHLVKMVAFYMFYQGAKLLKDW